MKYILEKLTLFIFLLIAAFAMLSLPLNAQGADWPTFLHDLPHTSNQNGDSGLSPQSVPGYNQAWAFQADTNIPDPYHPGSNLSTFIAASPTEVGNTAYVGSWNGYFYAIDTGSGTEKWKTNLGLTYSAVCNGSPQVTPLGVSSAASVQNGKIYVGGADPVGTVSAQTPYFYILDQASGSILGKVSTLTDTAHPGADYNWSSPALMTINGRTYAYFGLASNCDQPLVRGQLWQVDVTDPTNPTVANKAYFEPEGSIGGGVWTSPAIDQSTNTVYVTTGTPTGNSALEKSIVALDATTLAVKSSWQINPPEPLEADPDWASSPVVFTKNDGVTKLVAAGHKNGYIYAFNASNLSAGYVWRYQVDQGGPGLQSGQGVAVTPAFGFVPALNRNLLFLGGGIDPNNSSIPGSVTAVNPDDGTVVWKHVSFGNILASMAYSNGVIIDVTTNRSVEILDASTGNLIKSFAIGAFNASAPSIAGNMIFVGSGNGKLYAYSNPNLGSCQTLPLPTNTGKSVLTVNTLPGTTTQNYLVWARTKGTGTSANSFYLQVDSNCPSIVDAGANSSWNWTNQDTQNATLSVSLDPTKPHTISLVGKDQGVSIDRVIVTFDTTCQPTGTGDNCVNGTTSTPTPTPILATPTPTLAATPTPTPVPSPTPTPAPGTLPGYTYRMPITIDNTQGPTTLTQYQVPVVVNTQNLIAQSKMKSDCSDSAFTGPDGSTLLSFYLASGCNTSSTQYYVNVPSIAAQQQSLTYFYYGNASAAALSNGRATFPIFEDMTVAPQGSLKGTAVYDSVNQWVRFDTASQFTAGNLEYATGSLGMGIGDGFDATYQLWSGGGTGADSVWAYAYDTTTPSQEDTPAGGYHFAADEFTNQMQTRFNGSVIASAAQSNIANSTWHTMEVQYVNNEATLFFDGAQVNQYQDTTRSLTGNLIGFGGRSGSLTDEHRIRSIIVRKLATIQPAVTNGSEQKLM